MVLATVVVLLLTTPLLAACKQEAPPTAPTPTPIPAPTPAPTGPTGILVIAQKSLGNERWLPHFGSATEMGIAGEIYEFLTYRKPGGSELIPGLAEKWTMAPDGLTWTFNLRTGVQFHEGWGELTAADVKQSYDLIVSKESISTLAPYLRSNAKSVEATNPYQVVFRMAKPTWDLAYQLSTGIANFGIVSKRYIDAVGIDKAAQLPIGSGPFKFVDHKIGRDLKLEALDKHWRKVPQFKTLIYKAVPEDSTRLAMLKTGEADIIDISPDAKAEVEKAGFKIIQLPAAKSVGVHFGGMIFPTRATYDATIPWVGPDPQRALKVRKAIALAINKQEIIDFVLMRLGQPMAMHNFFPDMPQTDPAWKPYPYDPEQAKKLLAEAGYPNGFDMGVLEVVQPGKPENGLVAAAVAMQLGKVGIRVTLQKIEFATFRGVAADRKIGRVIFPLASSRFDEPVIILDRAGTSKVSLLLGVEDPKLDGMIAKALAELDYDKRLILQREIGQYLLDNVYYIGIASGSTIFAVNKKVAEWPLIPTMPYPFYFEYLSVSK